MAELLALALEVYEYATTAVQIFETAKDVAEYISAKVDNLFSRTSIDKGYHYEPAHVFVCFKYMQLVPQALAVSVFSSALTADVRKPLQARSFLILLSSLLSSAKVIGVNRFPNDQPYLMTQHPEFTRLLIPLLQTLYARNQNSFLLRLQDLIYVISPESFPIIPLYTRFTFEERYKLSWTNRESLVPPLRMLPAQTSPNLRARRNSA
uniref:Uncharacterized protein n=1 Tax=Myzus persicae nege-like virus 1 TaxID=2961857 RepID=A0A976X980_9VIRU|nr:hypothetical protein 1 [Myzus persicae nege-like virus 1]